ncbi:diguanylate cyclase [Richelia sinica FACHB-800]|uniref:Diguanylate cyclase n=1 Tax=Richelia sinica FACHB-800 TaxID=1357546 RepID=A0A975Y705_9NOST|nr:GGDEF domain-containing protein [Richelia sinica]MBD2665654.1 GGDEF domain-containing protein [Richelia sinica FACHB-800]QXE25830.1 diguanylate cyclase [Richelia sinica FACHB-800]
MNISLLVFGSNHFFHTLPGQIRDTHKFYTTVTVSVHQAKSHIQSQPPDLLLIQASLFGSLELCHWLKEQVTMSWIYCIVFEDRPEFLSQKSAHNWEWEIAMNTSALEQGADAYIWHLPTQLNTDDLPSLTAYHQLILAQLAVGTRKTQKYRDLLQKNDLLSAIALADSLTELNNRRALQWDLPRQISKSRTLGMPLSLIILDVDYFKKVNDTYGHLVGDRLLQLLCKRLRYNLRAQDTPFRYGGEEFVIILANTSNEEAQSVAGRLNQVVSDHPFTISHKVSVSITISLGVASLEPEDSEDGSTLLDRADQCLLAAKASGRNKVISWEHLSPTLRAVSS